MAIRALGYRPWTGKLRGPAFRFLPIARSALSLILRRKIFWLFLFISLLNFLMHSSVIYLVAQVEGQLGQRLPKGMSEQFLFTGTGTAYRNFLFFQGTVVMAMLALAGGILVGNDFRLNALAFYLSKPIGKIDYFLGKFAASSGLTALVTLFPAAALFIEFGAFEESFRYYRENLRILGAIVGYGALVSAVMPILLLGLSSLLKRTIPILIAWGGLFVFLPAAVSVIRNVYRSAGLKDPWAWGLLDLWSDLRWVSNVLFGIQEEVYGERWPYAALALAAACLISLAFFLKRISAVEVVR